MHSQGINFEDSFYLYSSLLQIDVRLDKSFGFWSVYYEEVFGLVTIMVISIGYLEDWLKFHYSLLIKEIIDESCFKVRSLKHSHQSSSFFILKVRMFIQLNVLSIPQQNLKENCCFKDWLNWYWPFIDSWLSLLEISILQFRISTQFTLFLKCVTRLVAIKLLLFIKKCKEISTTSL